MGKSEREFDKFLDQDTGAFVCALSSGSVPRRGARGAGMKLELCSAGDF
jgi:hypothetical protein